MWSVAAGQMGVKGDCIGSATFSPKISLIFNIAEQFGNFWEIFRNFRNVFLSLRVNVVGHIYSKSERAL